MSLEFQKINGDYGLHPEKLERVDAWGGASYGVSWVTRPSVVAGIFEAFQLARQNELSVGFRGGGNSYGDAAINNEALLLDLRRMNRILDWNPTNGIITVEPGVTIEQLWKYVLEDGWWIPVVTGTAKTTIGGCAAMNAHGKNGWQVGPIGEHILQFEMALPSGEIICCSREENSQAFYAGIGGAGLLGCFTSITMQLKRIYSGELRVEAAVGNDMGEMLQLVDGYARSADYAVGWIDAYPDVVNIGRGQIHAANYLAEGTEPYPQQSLRLERQPPPDFFMGIVPANIVWLLMRPFWNRAGMQLVNAAKFWSAKWQGNAIYRQSHASFHFLLDYVPNWKKAYGGGGLIQYQPFVPAANAERAFVDLLQISHKRGLPNFLTVLKRHRPDPFWLTHGLDGFSLAMDFRVTAGNRQTLINMCRQMDEVVLKYGGRFYFAKDSVLRPETAKAYLGEETINRFRTLKAQLDPENLLQTNLWRRIFPQSG